MNKTLKALAKEWTDKTGLSPNVLLAEAIQNWQRRKFCIGCLPNLRDENKYLYDQLCDQCLEIVVDYFITRLQEGKHVLGDKYVLRGKHVLRDNKKGKWFCGYVWKTGCVGDGYTDKKGTICKKCKERNKSEIDDTEIDNTEIITND